MDHHVQLINAFDAIFNDLDREPRDRIEGARKLAGQVGHRAAFEALAELQMVTAARLKTAPAMRDADA